MMMTTGFTKEATQVTFTKKVVVVRVKAIADR